MSKIKQEHFYLIIILSAVFCVFQYGIRKICGFTIYPDEFGYWASAAKAVGYDWVETASLGSYYSFGYSLVLIPILKLFQGGVGAYRAAVTVNMLLACVSMLLLWKISAGLFPEIGKVKRVFLSGIAVLYPPWVFYMQMTLAEALLMFLFVLLAYLIFCFIRKPGVKAACFLTVALIYAYCVHMRTVGVVLACLAVLILWGLSEPAGRKIVLAVLGLMAAAGLVLIFVKRNVILSVFTNADGEILAANDYASQMWKIRDILRPRGICLFAKEIIGKVFYLGMATCGIFYWGAGWCIKQSAGLLKGLARRSDDAPSPGQWLALFLILSAVGEILICSIYMHGSEKIDSLLYGRYNEFLVPVFLVTGIAAMFQSRHLFRNTLVMGTVSGLMLLPISSVIEKKELEGIRGYFVAGISRLICEEKFEPYLFLRDTWIWGFALMLFTAGIIWMVRRAEGAEWLLGILIMGEIALGLEASDHYIYEVNRAGFLDMVIAEKIEEESNGNTVVTYLDEGAPAFIDFLQMQLWEIPIHVVKKEMADSEGIPAAEPGDLGATGKGTGAALGDFVIVYYETDKKDALEQLYNRHIASNTYILYYNRTDP